MEYSHRTIIRHLGVATALLSLPFFLGSTGEVMVWFQNKWLFFGILLSAACSIGYLADRLVRMQWIAAWILKFMRKIPFSEPALDPEQFQKIIKSLSYTENLIYLWGSCSRCVAYWGTGFLIFFIFLFIWPLYDSTLAYIVVLIYFSILAASLASAIAVFIFLLRNY